MTEGAETCSFYDWQAFGRDVGFPEAVLIAPRRVLVSTWLRQCFVLDLESNTCRHEPEAAPPGSLFHAGRCLRSISTACGSPPICAVASRAAWASVWHLGDRESMTVHPERYGPVNSVAVSPRGDRLALGTGFYPLDPRHEPRAFVELWDTADSPVYIASRCLPGVAVDRLAWDAKGDTILVATGARSQDRGHVALLD
jgi:hypothetical protein